MYNLLHNKSLRSSPSNMLTSELCFVVIGNIAQGARHCGRTVVGCGATDVWQMLSCLSTATPPNQTTFEWVINFIFMVFCSVSQYEQLKCLLKTWIGRQPKLEHDYRGASLFTYVVTGYCVFPHCRQTARINGYHLSLYIGNSPKIEILLVCFWQMKALKWLIKIKLGSRNSNSWRPWHIYLYVWS